MPRRQMDVREMFVATLTMTIVLLLVGAFVIGLGAVTGGGWEMVTGIEIVVLSVVIYWRHTRNLRYEMRVVPASGRQYGALRDLIDRAGHNQSFVHRGDRVFLIVFTEDKQRGRRFRYRAVARFVDVEFARHHGANRREELAEVFWLSPRAPGVFRSLKAATLDRQGGTVDLEFDRIGPQQHRFLVRTGAAWSTVAELNDLIRQLNEAEAM
jgi:hypothetical protein